MSSSQPLHGLSRRALAFAGMSLAFAPKPAAAGTPLSISQLYGPVTADGIQLSQTAQALVGRGVALTGFMAPPLKAEADFFVLTRYPMSSCPFCSNVADWPLDIVFVLLGSAAEVVTPSYSIVVSGVLEHGMKVDPSTGFVSLVRVVEATWRKS